jgi:hypothetical protein
MNVQPAAAPSSDNRHPLGPEPGAALDPAVCRVADLPGRERDAMCAGEGDPLRQGNTRLRRMIEAALSLEADRMLCGEVEADEIYVKGGHKGRTPV